jgi:hypothetical protein
MGVNGAVLDIRAVLVLDTDLRNVQDALDMLQRYHPGDVAERALASFLHLGTLLTRAQLSPEVADYLVADDGFGTTAEAETRSIAQDVGSFIETGTPLTGGSHRPSSAEMVAPNALHRRG